MNIKHAIQDYFDIGRVTCPAFGDETIIFDDQGLRHIFGKHGKARPMSDQIRRLRLIPLAVEVLSESGICTAKTEIIKPGPFGPTRAYFWKFTKKKHRGTIHVIVRQIENGPKHFFSVMSKKVPTRP